MHNFSPFKYAIGEEQEESIERFVLFDQFFRRP